MRVIIAPDSFKESLSAVEVAKYLCEGFRLGFPEAELICLPIADGGEGTVEVMIASTGGRRVVLEVKGPLERPVSAFYGITGDGKSAVIEMAAASGLALVPPEQRNPLVTTSYGTGELILDALNRGIRNFIIGIGGSATNDAGAGMLQALGGKLLDGDGGEIGRGGGELCRLATVDVSNLDPRLSQSDIKIACDVDNPLIGASGASEVFAPQKGADAEMVALLEKNLTHFAGIVERDLNKSITELPGGGAAGGMGCALHAFLGGHLCSGVDIVLNAVGMKNWLKGADIVITGEGRMDGQSFHGKAPVGVARMAAEAGVPVIAVAGSLGQGCEKAFDHCINAIYSISSSPQSLEEALRQTGEHLQFWARNTASVIRLFWPGFNRSR